MVHFTVVHFGGIPPVLHSIIMRALFLSAIAAAWVVVCATVAVADTAEVNLPSHFQHHRHEFESWWSSASSGPTTFGGGGSSSGSGGSLGPSTFNGTGKGWHYYCEGNCLDNVNRRTQPGAILMGGGLDVGAAFKQQIKWSGGGDFLVLRSDLDPGYNDWIFTTLGGVNSVTTLVVYSKDGADSSFVVERVLQSEAIFIAGGNQWHYFEYWRNTRLELSLHTQKGVIPFGGTSAGCMVLPHWVFDAEFGGIVSSDALQNPTQQTVSAALTRGYLVPFPQLNRTLIDTHFVTRDRFGRLLTFMANLAQDDVRNVSTHRPIFGIGIDEHTAFAVDPYETTKAPAAMSDGPVVSSAHDPRPRRMATLLGNGTAYVLRVTHKATDLSSNPLTMAAVEVQKLVAGDVFDFSTMTGGQPQNAYSVGAADSTLSQADPYNP